MQCFGIYALYHVSNESDAATEAIAIQKPEIVATDVFYLPEQTPRLFFEKQVLEINDSNVDKLVETLRNSPQKEFILVLSPTFRRISDETLAKLLEAAPAVENVKVFEQQPGSGFINLFITTCRVKDLP
jgi:hypothetical protein